MNQFDWRELYAANQEKIRAALGDRATSITPASSAGVTRGRPTAGARTRELLTARRGGHAALVHAPAWLKRGTPAPLICMLHGCTQDPAAFAAATLMNAAADRDGFVVVYPGQDRGSNPQGCWNWFLPEHQRRGAGEPGAIATIVSDLIAADEPFTVDPARVFVAGLSSGGAMAATLAACYPELFAGLAVHSGLAYRSASDVASAFAVMRAGGAGSPARPRGAPGASGPALPVASIVIHGSADRTVAPANAIEVLRQSMAANHLAAPQSANYDVSRPTRSARSRSDGGLAFNRSQWLSDEGTLMHELLEVDGLGHAWSGGASGGSYTDPRGPSATAEICRFFSLTTAR